MGINNYLYSGNKMIDKDQTLVLRAEPSIALRFITDRTQEDVDRVKELQAKILSGEYTEDDWKAYLNDMKGALNYSDLDRIEANLELLSGWLNVSLVSMDRDVIPRVPYFRNLLINVQKIRDSVYCPLDADDVPEMPINTYEKVNEIERILLVTFRRWLRNHDINLGIYCGTEMYGNSVLI